MSTCNSTEPDSGSPGDPSNPLVITKGLTFGFIVRVFKSPVNGGGPFPLNGPPAYTGRSELRRLAADQGTPVADLEVTNHPTQKGRADVRLSAVITASLSVGNYVLDVLFENDTDPTEVIKGTPGELRVKVVDGVTKPE